MEEDDEDDEEADEASNASWGRNAHCNYQEHYDLETDLMFVIVGRTYIVSFYFYISHFWLVFNSKKEPMHILLLQFL